MGNAAFFHPCAEVDSSEKLPWRDGKVIQGKPLVTKSFPNETLAANADLAKEARITRRADYMIWGFRSRTEPVKRCAPVFRAQFQASINLGYAGEVIPDGDTALLMSWLLDHGASSERSTLPLLRRRTKPAATSTAL